MDNVESVYIYRGRVPSNSNSFDCESHEGYLVASYVNLKPGELFISYANATFGPDTETVFVSDRGIGRGTRGTLTIRGDQYDLNEHYGVLIAPRQQAPQDLQSEPA